MGTSRVFRGGSWFDNAGICRSGYRDRDDPAYFSIDQGFRVAKTTNKETQKMTNTANTTLTITITITITVNGPKADPTPAMESPEMVDIPGGSFLMGDDESRWEDERPAHHVRVEAFAMAKYPVTIRQYGEYLKATGKSAVSEGEEDPNLPVVNVSWHDAVAYCEWLSKKTGENHRLPTEEEWEYACRAGSTTKYSCGDDLNELNEYAWHYGNSDGRRHPVGEKLPNDWGLFDMHGLVLEWTGSPFSDYSK